MSLEQQVADLVTSTGALTTEVVNKMGKIDAAVAAATADLKSKASLRTAAFKNRIINGDMRIDQRKAGAVQAALSFTGGVSVFAADRFRSNWSQMPTGIVSFQQIYGDAPPGFSHSIKVSVTTAEAPAADKIGTMTTLIEASNVTDFAFGTDDAAPTCLTFWVKSTVPGTYTVALSSGPTATDTQYLANYTVNAANTWERKVIVLPAPKTGTWQRAGTGVGVRLDWNLGSGANFVSNNKNVWTVGRAFRTPGDVNLIEQISSWQLSGCQFEKGNEDTPFEFRPITTELALCQRYYYQTDAFETIAQSDQSGAGAYGVSPNNNWCFSMTPTPPVVMRANPTVIVKSATGGRAPGTVSDWTGGANVTFTSASAPAHGSPRMIGLNLFTAGRAYAFDYSLNAEL